jgi:inner membrane protein
MDENGYYEGYYSVLDGDNNIRFSHYPSEKSLLAGLEDDWNTQRLQWFSKGFYSVRNEGNRVVISDLRMGYEPDYVFSFAVAELGNPHASPIRPVQLQANRDWSLLEKIWARIWDRQVVLVAG